MIDKTTKEIAFWGPNYKFQVTLVVSYKNPLPSKIISLCSFDHGYPRK